MKSSFMLLAFFSIGCDIPKSPQTITTAEPQNVVVEVKVSDGKITVNDATRNLPSTGAASAERCDCGCGHDGCRCSGRSLTRSAADTRAGSPPQIVSALADSKPVVEMLTDFDDGACAACDLAWSDWKTNGKQWPFVLVKRRGTGGRSSPTFRFEDGRVWSPATYSPGALLDNHPLSKGTSSD